MNSRKAQNIYQDHFFFKKQHITWHLSSISPTKLRNGVGRNGNRPRNRTLDYEIVHLHLNIQEFSLEFQTVALNEKLIILKMSLKLRKRFKMGYFQENQCKYPRQAEVNQNPLVHFNNVGLEDKLTFSSILSCHSYLKAPKKKVQRPSMSS